MKKKIFAGLLSTVMTFGACTVVGFADTSTKTHVNYQPPAGIGLEEVHVNQNGYNENYEIWKAINELKKSINGEQDNTQEEADSDEIKVTVNGEKIIFDVPPQLINNCTMVPLRKIFEAIGADVLWDGVTQTVTATKGDQKITATINNTNAYVNGALKTLNVPPVIIDGRTLVPVRFIATALGANVEWNSETKTVVINT